MATNCHQLISIVNQLKKGKGILVKDFLKVSSLIADELTYAIKK